MADFFVILFTVIIVHEVNNTMSFYLCLAIRKSIIILGFYNTSVIYTVKARPKRKSIYNIQLQIRLGGFYSRKYDI